MEDLEIFTTGDGSHSLLHKILDETYHSRHGARQESAYVFIEHGLRALTSRSPESVRILEIGFGTGLNALLTLQEARHLNCKIDYVTLEAFPVDEPTWKKLNYASSDEEQIYFEKLHQAPWSRREKISEDFFITKIHDTLQRVSLQKDFFDLVYFDAFAPNKQPEMWTCEILNKVTDAMRAEAIFVTYCAKGQLKRDLKSLLLSVETLKGPPGKREMTRAKKV